MKKTITTIVFALLAYAAFGQFDKKVTFNAFAGATLPVGPRMDADSVPYVFSNFRNGLQAGIGGQYNLSTKFSFGLNLTALVSINYSNPLPAPSGKEDIITAEQKNYSASYFTNIGLGADVRYKFFRTANFNPYVFGEFNVNNYAGYVAPRLQYYEQPVGNQQDYIQDKYTILRFNSKQITSSFAVGVNFGAGVDIKLSDSFTLMVQGGYYSIFTASNTQLNTNLNYIGAQTGLRFSLFRSKSIL